MDEENVKTTEQLSREEALKILGLPADADDNTVKQRYGALLRAYKHRTDEKGTTYEDLEYYENISLAYDTVFGFSHDFGDDNPSSPIPYKIRKKWGKFLTVIEQYWFAFLLVAIVVVLGVTFVVQRINGGKEDLIVKFVGAFGEDPTTNLTQQMNEKSELFDNMQVTFFTVTTNTSMLEYSARTGAENFEAQLMSPGELDVILMDKESFDVYVEKGVLVPLGKYLDEYLKEHKIGTYLGTYSYGSEPDEQGNVRVPEGVYGIDVTDTKFFEGTGMTWFYNEEAGQEKSMIFTIASNTKRPEIAFKFLDELLEGIYENTAG